jgi:Fe2+ or Zn2+ uptake regulation protein
MEDHTDLDYTKILEFYKIAPTSIRIEVLKAIYSTSVEFDIQEIINLLKSAGQDVNRNSVMSVLRLYRSRGLLVRVQKIDQKDKAGRPAVKFLLSGEHILTSL